MPTRPTALDTATADRVRGLVAQAPGALDNPPLSEQTLLNLQSGPPLWHGLITMAGQVVGYAQCGSDSHEPALELVTGVADRGPSPAAVADALVAAALADLPSGTQLSLWSHGEQSTAEQLARTRHWQATRRLHQMRRPLDGIHRSPAGIRNDGLVIRTFTPGVDEPAWLELNHRAFLDHPEQGGWTRADLDARMAATWFDPAGFFLAERDGTLLAFHWTKIHPEMRPPAGEVYVIGVHPDAQGQRLGAALLDIGLRYLSDRGLASVLLYVDADNDVAVRLYEKAGFSIFSTDTRYRVTG